MSKSKFKQAGALAHAALESFGITERHYALFGIWDREAGGYARFAEVVGMHSGVLRVKVTNPHCYQEMRLQKAQLLKKINGYFGVPLLKDIKFITAYGNERT